LTKTDEGIYTGFMRKNDETIDINKQTLPEIITLLKIKGITFPTPQISEPIAPPITNLDRIRTIEDKIVDILAVLTNRIK